MHKNQPCLRNSAAELPGCHALSVAWGGLLHHSRPTRDASARVSSTRRWVEHIASEDDELAREFLLESTEKAAARKPTCAAKKVTLELDGTDTELARSSKPSKLSKILTRAIRSAVDHGIESTERRRAGKSATGRILLRASPGRPGQHLDLRRRASGGQDRGASHATRAVTMLTGMGSDGVAGAAELAAVGRTIVAQDLEAALPEPESIRGPELRHVGRATSVASLCAQLPHSRL